MLFPQSWESERCHYGEGSNQEEGEMKSYYVYILASKRNGTLYIGITNDLQKRTIQHKLKEVIGFTRKYDVDKLVYFERFRDADSAILREKRLKKWNRKWKLRIIEEFNPDWEDLFYNYTSDTGLPPPRQ